MNSRIFLPLGHAVLGFVAALSFAASARAADAPAGSTPEPAVSAPPAPSDSPARALFKEARALVANGNYKAACPKFEQSLALEPGVGTQFNLADCWEHIGRTLSARALFMGAAASAKAAGQLDREQVLHDRAAALEPRIPHLVIEVDGSDPKLVVKRGDLPLDSDVYGKAKAVDPGTYEIVAKAPGKIPWRKTVEVPVGDSVVTVTVPALEAQVPSAAPAPEIKKHTEAATPARDVPAVSHGSSTPSLGVVGLGVLGAGGVAFGIVMAARYRSANSDAKNICPTSLNCTTQQISVHDGKVDDARSARTWAYVGLGVGGASLAAAAALLFLPQHRNESAWRATPLVGSDGLLGAGLSGKF